MSLKKLLLCLTVSIVYLPYVKCKAEPLDFYIVWGGKHDCAGQLNIINGQIRDFETYSFAKASDKVTDSSKNILKWKSKESRSAKGIHVFVDVEENTAISYKVAELENSIKFSELSQKSILVDPVGTPDCYIILGIGDPTKGPQAFYQQKLPEIYRGPAPQNVLQLADKWQDGSVTIFTEKDIVNPRIRRQSMNDGILYVEVFAGYAIDCMADIKINDEMLDNRHIEDSLWLSLNPKIGMLSVRIITPSETHNLSCPATLIETRSNQLFLNGEPFLMKGALPRGLNDVDAEFIRGLGVNTIRGVEAVKTAEKYGFMTIASIQKGLGKFRSYNFLTATADFEKDYAAYINYIDATANAAVKSRYTLIIQLGNELVDGVDPWSDLVGPQHFSRLNQALAGAYNVVKPKDPMLPIGYANHALSYIAPMFLDVYMHNTYMNKDRYGVPLETYIKRQSCDKRPFVNSEFGANRYAPQAYHGAENHPVLEKIHAWNFPNRWKEFMDAGTVGGVIYCLYDLDEPRDQGCSNFGILTYDRQPKLACWEIGRLWRDFEVIPDQDHGSKKLLIKYKRNYWARDCVLHIDFIQQQKNIRLADFAPQTRRQIDIGDEGDSFRWTIEYTTHNGLKMLSKGAYPLAVEQNDFLSTLGKRKYADFLKELFDAEVITAQGQTAPATLADMKLDNNLIPVAFRKPNGIIYLTAYFRHKIEKDIYKTVDIETTFHGKCVKVDEFTGAECNEKVSIKETKKGLVIQNVKAPIIPGPLGERSEKPISLPVFKFTDN